MPAATWTILTPPAGQGAIAIVQLRGTDPTDFARTLAAIGLDTPVGRPQLRDLLGADRGPVVRWNDTTTDLFPHAGPAILRRLVASLTDRGIPQADSTVATYPEAADELEQRMLEAVSRAASPLAVDLLLDQPRRWREAVSGPDSVCHGRVGRAGEPCAPARPARPWYTDPIPADPALANATILNRLIDPPLVVAIGPSNIGKSTLLNALAGREMAIVADEPGTTRDHVGATLDLAGLTIRYLDTPGLRPDPTALDLAARELVAPAEAAADLLLLCGDPHTPCPAAPLGRPALRVCLRRDLGKPAWSADLELSVHDGSGVGDLVGAVRQTLLPAEALADPRPWRFWSTPAP